MERETSMTSREMVTTESATEFSPKVIFWNPHGKKQQHPARACFDFDFDFELFRGSARWVHCYGQ
jgi:hypothetical protein